MSVVAVAGGGAVMPADGGRGRRFLPRGNCQGKACAATIDEIHSAQGGFEWACEPATQQQWKVLTSAGLSAAITGASFQQALEPLLTVAAALPRQRPRRVAVWARVVPLWWAGLCRQVWGQQRVCFGRGRRGCLCSWNFERAARVAGLAKRLLV